MATDKQIAANRRNALKSTGPKTPRGKAVSSRNAFVHGLRSAAAILPGEDPTELAQLRSLFVYSSKPQTADQLDLVEQMAYAEWKLRHWKREEDRLIGKAFTGGKLCPTGTFLRITQRQGRYERAYLKAFQEFNRLAADNPIRARPAA